MMLAHVLVLFTALASPIGVGPPAAVGQVAETCDLCHAELEFLRQHVETLDQARALLFTREDIARSAHRDQNCQDCHQGFARWPHSEAASTEPCEACHADSEARWSLGAHALPDETGAPAADCAACHGVHEVEVPAAGTSALNARCQSCHTSSVLAVTDPHADSVACADCHGAHELRSVDDPEAWIAPARQIETCGACHAGPAEAYAVDAHGSSFGSGPPETLMSLNALAGEAAPACTSCHGSHDVRGSGGAGPPLEQAALCGGCHADRAGSFDDSYHGQASALGSRLVADCSACHTAHSVFPTSDPRSAVNPANLIETCGQCHEGATASFVQFAPHADHGDRGRNPAVFWSYVSMTALLLGVFTFFGLHSGLWIVRVGLDRSRAARRGPDQGGTP